MNAPAYAPAPPIDDDLLIRFVARLPPPGPAVTTAEIRAAATAYLLWLEHWLDPSPGFAVTRHGWCLHRSRHCSYVPYPCASERWYGRDARPETWPCRQLSSAQAVQWLRDRPGRRMCDRCWVFGETVAAAA